MLNNTSGSSTSAEDYYFSSADEANNDTLDVTYVPGVASVIKITRDNAAAPASYDMWLQAWFGSDTTGVYSVESYRIAHTVNGDDVYTFNPILGSNANDIVVTISEFVDETEA